MKYGFHDQGVDSKTGASKRKVDCTIQRWEQLVPEGRGYGAQAARMQGCGTWSVEHEAFLNPCATGAQCQPGFRIFPPLVFLLSVITRQSLQQSSLKHSLKFWKWADAIRSACTAGHGGHLVELAQSLALFSHCCCPVALWLPAMELPQCRRVWANEELLCNSNPARASEERKINCKVVCAVVQLLEDQSSWEPIYYWMAF